MNVEVTSRSSPRGGTLTCGAGPMKALGEAEPGRRGICTFVACEVIDEQLLAQGLVEPRLVPLDGPAAFDGQRTKRLWTLTTTWRIEGRDEWIAAARHRA